MKRGSRMRVAIILPSFDVGGTENMVANLVQYIDKSRFQVLVLSLAAPMETHIKRRIEDSGVAIFYGMKGQISSWRVFGRVYRALADFHPDLIHSNMYAYAFAVPYLLLHRVTLLHTIHNKPVNEFKEKYKKLIGFLYKGKKAVPVAISHIVEKEMRELYPGLSCIERVYNPVETKRFHTEEKRTSGQKIIFISVARFMRQKNQKLLLDAFAEAEGKLPGIRLVLVGDGELRESLEKQAEKLGISDAVIFAGKVENVRDYLAAADVFVLSSDYEGLPLSILEAMASGLPILSTDVGGIADIVTDNGILVSAGDKSGLASAMTELAFNEAKRRAMGARSEAYAKQYDSEEFIRQYEALYEKYGGGKDCIGS